MPKPTRPFTGRFPVRGFGSGKIHLADLVDGNVSDLVVMNHPCFGGLLSVFTLCTAEIGRNGKGWVVMEPDATITCTPCRRRDMIELVRESHEQAQA